MSAAGQDRRIHEGCALGFRCEKTLGRGRGKGGLCVCGMCVDEAEGKVGCVCVACACVLKTLQIDAAICKGQKEK